MAKKRSVKRKFVPKSKNKVKLFFEYLGYLGIVVGVIGIILLLKVIGEVK